MNKRIAAELKNELSFIEAGIDVEKHAYAMQRLLELLSDSQNEDSVPEAAKLEGNVTIHCTPIAKTAADEDDGGNGKDIFDF